MDLNDIVKPQDVALTKIAKVFPSEKSVKKQPYAKGKTFRGKDVLKILSNIGRLIRLIKSLNKSVKLIKSTDITAPSKAKISKPDFDRLKILMEELSIVSYGYLKIVPDYVFQDKGLPFKNALIITINMDKQTFETAPSMEAQIEVMRVYGETGRAVNKISEFLRKNGYNAVPNHSMGGSVDYCKAGMNAGLGYIGRHGMLMTPENGSCHRSALVYTDIENLGTFIEKKSDHSWIAEFCSNCGKCIKKCPTNAIFEKPKIDSFGNVMSIDYDKCCEGFKTYGCGVCIKECPFTKIGYEKIHHNYMRKLTKRRKAV
jgi:epoxyqueuosine reductase